MKVEPRKKPVIKSATPFSHFESFEILVCVLNIKYKIHAREIAGVGDRGIDRGAQS